MHCALTATTVESNIRPADALSEYEKSLTESPNRLNALTGAARAAQLTGDRTKAATYYGRVAALLGNSGT